MDRNEIFKFSLDFMEKIIQYSDFNTNINKNYLKKCKFSEEEIEKKFIEFYKPKNKLSKIISDVIILIGYFISFIYIILGYYHLEILIIFSGFFVLTIFCMIFSYKIQDEKIIYFLDHLNIFFMTLSHIFKAIFICIYLNTKENDNSGELLRIMMYQNLSVNIFLLLKFDAIFLVYTFYYLLNVGIIILSIIYSYKNHFYYMEIITNFLVVYIFYAIRRLYDYLARSIFSEKLQIENLYNYTFEFIYGLNCYKIYLNNDEIIIGDEKLTNLLSENVFKSPNEKANINNKENKEMINYINSEANFRSENLFIDKFENSSQHFKTKNTNILIKKNFNPKSFVDERFSIMKNFMKHLIPFNDSYISKEYIDKNISLENELNLEENLERLRIQEKEIITENNLKINIFKKLGIYYLKDEKNLKNNKYFEIFYRSVSMDVKKGNHFYDLLFYDVSEIIISKITLYEEEKIKQKVLAKIAHEFKTPINSIIGLISNIKIFFEKVEYYNNRIENNSNDQKNFTENQNERNKEVKNSLDIVKNLSEYVIILVNDIIQFSNINNNKVKGYIPNLTNIDIKETSIFCFEILKCLLNCNSSKSESIVPIYEFDNILNEKNLISDGIKIKQVLLNFISNSVKFTKFGKIELCFEFDELNNCLIIKVEDTGIGIKEEDKQKLFNDFTMLEDGKKHNAQGSGLGLSICKLIAQSINIKIDFFSEYGKGSCFKIILPLEDKLYLSRYNKNYDENDSCDSEITINNFQKNDNSYSNPLEIVENRSSKINNTSRLNSEFCDDTNEKKSEFDLSERIKEINFSKVYNKKYSKKSDLNKFNNSNNNKKNKISKDKIYNEVNISNNNELENLNIRYSDDIFIKKNNINKESIISSSSDRKKIKESLFSISERREEIINAIIGSKSNKNSKSSLRSNLNLGNKKILIVDDNKFLNDSLKKILELVLLETNKKIDIVQLRDGVDIIKNIIDDQTNGNLIKCVLMDENMEYVNGSEAVIFLKDLERRSRILGGVKFITTTSHESSEKIEFMRSIGIDKVLEKPITKSSLSTALKEIRLL